MKHVLDVIKVGGLCPADLAELGADAFMVTDFDEAERLARSLGKPGFTPKMSNAHNDFTEETGFWLFLREGGNLVAAAAARFDDVGTETMQSYLGRTMRRQYPHQSGEALVNVSPVLPPDFNGALAYVGELYVREGDRGSRRKLRNFMMIMHSCIATKWEVDWIYAFMRDRDVKLGFATLYGFTLQLPGVAEWSDPPPKGRGSSEWLVAMSRQHLEHIMRYYSGSFERL
jgi:hypothetical protein